MTVAEQGQLVRIVMCPGRQHEGETGTVVKANGRLMYVELDSQRWCWTAYVEPIETEVKT